MLDRKLSRKRPTVVGSMIDRMSVGETYVYSANERSAVSGVKPGAKIGKG
jgi:hypothetical protein